METPAAVPRLSDIRQASRAQYHASRRSRILASPRPVPMVFHFALPALDRAQRPRPLAPVQVVLHRLQRGMRRAVPWVGGALLGVVCLAGLYWLLASLPTWEAAQKAPSVSASTPSALPPELDGFLGMFRQVATVFGFVMGTIGMLGYVFSLFDGPYRSLLGGAMSFFLRAAILGALTVMLGSLSALLK